MLGMRSRGEWTRALPSRPLSNFHSDYRGAKSAGLTALLLRRLEKEEFVPDDAKGDTITSLTEVVDRVDRLNGRVDDKMFN